MLVKKELVVSGKKAVLSYDGTIFGKDANTLKYEEYEDAEILFLDSKIRVKLLVNGEECYSDSESKYVPEFYFEIVDFDDFDNELAFSDAIYESVSNEEELIKLLTKESYFINNMDTFKECPKGYVAGWCDEEASEKCEYSALKVKGLCGAECLNCNGDIHAYKDDEAYICGCNKILFKDRNFDKR